MAKWAVHKFGGTSAADAGRYKAVAEILLARRAAGERAAVVVSAMSGVTDALLRERGCPSDWLYAREVLLVESEARGVAVNREDSGERPGAWLDTREPDPFAIIGCIASTRDGVATTPKRNGSDYSASIFAALPGAGPAVTAAGVFADLLRLATFLGAPL
ncbi:MAG TPA: hypothetical protein VF621_08390 [Pyrinomonadaceae bacterium]